MTLLPQDFTANMRLLLGEERADELCTALLESSPVVSLRHNPDKPSEAFAQAESMPWCEAGRYLSERPRFTFDPLFHAGAYYVQEAASMFIEQAYRTLSIDGSPQRMLDLCAAPGGKSTLWRSLLPTGALLVANDPIRSRANILAENLAKWGHPDVVVTQAYAEHFLPLTVFFDLIAADVPCSGEGMMRKDQVAREEWSVANVKACAQRQRDIIETIWPTLRTGGYLVYSTCTFNREENEDNVLHFCETLGAECVTIDTDPQWGIMGDCTAAELPVYRFMPPHTRGEGFFLALLRKTAPTPETRSDKSAKKKGNKGGCKSSAPPRELTQWLSRPEEFSLISLPNEHVVAVRSTLLPYVQRLLELGNCMSVGIDLAEVRGHKLIPQPPLALSTALSPFSFPRFEVDLPQALDYLRREAIVLPPEQPRGYVLLTYQDHPLGFVNNLGTRANNLYPQEWRIRSQI